MDRTIHATPTSVDQMIEVTKTPERVWVTRRPLPGRTRSALIALCNGSPNAEICGYIDDSWEPRIVGNIHDMPSHNFLMDQQEHENTVREIYAEHRRILGVFHTHPNNTPWPTPRDIVGWPDARLEIRYFIVTHNDVIEWYLP